jgi:hypothetical protein
MTLPTLNETEVCGPIVESDPTFEDDSRPRVLASGGTRVWVCQGRVQWHEGAFDVAPVLHVGKSKWGVKLCDLLKEIHEWQ